MPLAPEARKLLDMVYRTGAPRFHELSVGQARHASEKMYFAFRPEAPAVSSVVDVPISRSDGSVLLSRFYRPFGHSPDEVLPLLLFLHGGGWTVGDVPSYDVLCRQLANEAGCAVLSVDYRLAPEHPFPAGLQDVVLAWHWAQDNAGLLKVDESRMAMGGDSAGGNLTLAATLSLRDAGQALPVCLLLVYPCTEILSTRASRAVFADGFLLDRESLAWFFRHYLPCGSVTDWRASPMLAESLAGLPPMLLVTAECDPLTDDCLAFAERVVSEGGEVQHLNVPGVIHGFFALGKVFPQAAQALQWSAGHLRSAFSE